MKSADILIVDDEKDLAEGLAEVVELEGHRATVAFSGEEALDKIRGKTFDVIILDIKLPGMNGVECFLKIREENPDARVIMMTGYRIEQLLAQAVDNGAAAVLHKPFAPEKLLELIDQVRPQGIVLVVDDDPNLAESLRDMLTAQGYQVIVATTGEEAVERVLAIDIDVLVLDLRLPVLSGLEVYLDIQSHGRAVPTVIITGYAREEAEAIETLTSFEHTGCLFKPFEPEQLLRAIETLGGVG